MKLLTHAITSILLVSVICLAAYAELQLKKKHPDFSPEYVYNERFTIEYALKCLDTVHSSLDSFRKLTEFAKKHFPEKIKKFENTSWDMQYLGFENAANNIEGTLRKQDYLLKKTEYELAQKKYEDKEITADELKKCKEDFIKSEKSFQKFWDDDLEFYD